jgi:D-3-phosphoglycerate dehydrogenase / 2-oxoglutarate reductase
MTTTLSRSKDKIRILLLEGISPTASDALAAAGYTSVQHLPKALNGAALREALSGISMVGIRS